ncbi:MAG: DUF6263 family protein [Kofleriaceae bacterium]
MTLVFVVFGACGGSQNAADVATPSAAISLVEPGAEPRRRLRYDLVPHARERFEIETKLHISTAFTNTVLEEGQRSVEVPTVRLVGHVEVTSVSSRGEAVISSVVDDVAVFDDSADPGIRSRTEAEVAVLKGLRTSWRMDPSGRTVDIAVETPKGSKTVRLLRSLADSIRENAVVFPEQEVGLGATWQVVSKLSSSSITWTRTVKYRVTALTETSVTVLTQVVMRASSQALSVEPNATTTLTSGEGNMTGELLLRRQAVMVTGRAQGNSEMNFQIVRGRLRITSTLRWETLTSIQSAAEGGEHGSVLSPAGR